MIERIVEWVTPIFAHWGLPIVFLATFLETSVLLGLVVPGETVVILAGILANPTFRSGLGAPADMPVSIRDVIVIATIGAIAGDHTGYLIGRFGGRRLVSRSRRLASPERLRAAETYYRKHGGKTIFFGRFTPLLRSLGAMVAGMSKMSYPRFAAWDIVGAVLWGTGIPLIGYFFGRYGTSSIKAIDRILRAPGYAVLFVGALALLAYLLKPRKRRFGSSDSGGPPT